MKECATLRRTLDSLLSVLVLDWGTVFSRPNCRGPLEKKIWTVGLGELRLAVGAADEIFRLLVYLTAQN